MASNFPPRSRQTDWELFSTAGRDDLYFDGAALALIDRTEYIDEAEAQTLAAPTPEYRCWTTEDHEWVNFEPAGTTPTQTSSILSRFFGPSSSTALTTMTATTPARQGVSPSSSPRLPSPPPYTEVQIGPKSPSIGERNETDLPGATGKADDGFTRRIRPGTRSADMASGPPLIPLSQLDSPFQLQEHLKALYHTYTKSADNSATTPITRESAMTLAAPPEGIDRQLWLYELCRFLTMRANNLIIAFFAESPPCSSHTCPEMRASEWQYLCAVHDPPKSCCAIDYCCHTLDWATNILTSPKYFPSRLTLGSEAAGGAQASMRHLTNIFRRVYRIFAHAWFQHRGVFWQVEGHDGLYVFFKTVCDAYALIPEDNYTIPPEAEGTDLTLETPISRSGTQIHVSKNNTNPSNSGQNGTDPTNVEAPDMSILSEANTTISTGATTRRHKHTPSTGTNVTTITEDEEEPGSTDSHPSSSDSNENIKDSSTQGSPDENGEADVATNNLANIELNEPQKSTDTAKAEDPASKSNISVVPATERSPAIDLAPRESRATTLETLEQNVEDPVQGGAKNTADTEIKEATQAAPEDAAT